MAGAVPKAKEIADSAMSADVPSTSRPGDPDYEAAVDSAAEEVWRLAGGDVLALQQADGMLTARLPASLTAIAIVERALRQAK